MKKLGRWERLGEGGGVDGQPSPQLPLTMSLMRLIGNCRGLKEIQDCRMLTHRRLICLVLCRWKKESVSGSCSNAVGNQEATSESLDARPLRVCGRRLAKWHCGRTPTVSHTNVAFFLQTGLRRSPASAAFGVGANRSALMSGNM